MMRLLSAICNFTLVLFLRFIFTYKFLILAIGGIAFTYSATAQDYEWAKRIGGSGNDYARSIVKDASGNVYITGQFLGTVDFDPSNAVRNLTSAGSIDIFFAKYDALGNYVWAKSVGGESSEGANSIAVDALGYVYITGHFQGTVDFDPGVGTENITHVSGNDVFFAKYDTNGDYIWAKSIGGYGEETGHSIAVDGNSNVYITGYIQGTADFDPGVGIRSLTPEGGMESDIFFAKYDTNGDYLWAKNVGGVSGDIGRSIAVDASGSVYIAGMFWGTADFDPDPNNIAILSSSGKSDMFFAKYNTNGDYIWAKSVGGVESDFAISTTVDISGNVYITGYFWETADFDPNPANTENLTSEGFSDIFFAKYDTNGSYIWAKSIRGSDWDEGRSIAVDAFGSVYIAGYFAGIADFDPGVSTKNLASAGAGDVFFAKYDPNGNYLWAKSVGGSDSDFAYSLAVDDFGALYITGYFYKTTDFDPSSNTANLTSVGRSDIFIAKYTQCLNSVSHSGIVTSGIYTAGQYISSTATLSGNIIYSAGNTIILLPGFEADTGKVFEAKIQGCY